MDSITTGNGRVTGLAHVGIYTHDMEASIQFYKDSLGFSWMYEKQIPLAEGTIRLVLMQNGTCAIELIQPVPPGLRRTNQRVPFRILHWRWRGLKYWWKSSKNKVWYLKATRCARHPVIMRGQKSSFLMGPAVSASNSLNMFNDCRSGRAGI